MIEDNPYWRPSKKEIISREALLYFVWEREAIKIAKDNKYQGVLTADPILSKYKFTNIRRKDDRVSKWIIKNIIEVECEQDLWFSLLIARLINWPPTLKYLIDENFLLHSAEKFDAVNFSNLIEQYRQTGAKAYSGAYMVYPTKKDVGAVKSLSIAKYIISPSIKLNARIKSNLKQENSIENFVEILSGCFGISTFIAGQVAADMTYLEAPLHSAKDLYSYAPIGPGSSKGLNYLLGRSAYASWKQEDFNKELININDDIKTYLEIEDLTLHDVQNIMCEYSKYTRTILKEGTPKTMYKPEKEF